jgi:hypothetical protein
MNDDIGFSATSSISLGTAEFESNIFHILVSQNCLPKNGSTYLGKCDNLNFKEKSSISSDNRES